MVRSHNAFRIYHGSQDLVEADDLTRDAQMWADIIAEKSFLQYSELPGYFLIKIRFAIVIDGFNKRLIISQSRNR